jgi:hypothetical protein
VDREAAPAVRWISGNGSKIPLGCERGYEMWEADLGGSAMDKADWRIFQVDCAGDACSHCDELFFFLNEKRTNRFYIWHC